MRTLSSRLLVTAALLGTGAVGCGEATQPSYVSVAHLQGSPYERGLQHGQQFSREIRSLYTRLLTASILPYLNREQPDIASVLSEYTKPEYGGGQFSFQIMLQSGQAMLQDLPPELIEEMHGVADGAELPFDQVLVLNTFFETMLGFRALTFFLRKIQAPTIVSVGFSGGLETDGVDNDGDGETDEADEGLVEPYDPSPYGLMTEVPTDASIHVLLKDQALLGIVDGVDDQSLRVQLDDQVFESGHPALQTIMRVVDAEPWLEVIITPPAPLPPASVVSLQIHAADLSWTEDPPPGHARVMRGERFVFSTEGYGAPPHEVENIGAPDGFSQPPSQSFAVRGSATRSGDPLLGHHFAMLDSDTLHKHTVLFVHQPDQGLPHAVLGWSGVVGGFSGMNAAGLATAINSSDSLDIPMAASVVEDLFDATLIGRGLPGTMLTRELLTHCTTAAEALEYVRTHDRAYSFNLLLADAAGDLTAVEADCDALGDGDGGVFPYTPDPSDPANLDEHGRLWSSVGPDDIRMASHYRVNVEDAEAVVLDDYTVTPQRTWTSYYFRSVRAYYRLGVYLQERYGQLDVSEAIEVLRQPDIVDTRDSMTSAVFDPASLTIHYAMGQVPATDAPYVPFDLGAAFGGSQQ